MNFGDHVLVARTIVRVVTDRTEHYEDQPADTIERTTGFKLQRSVGYRPTYRSVIGHTRRARYFTPTPINGDHWDEWPGIGITEADAPAPQHRTSPSAPRKPYDVEPEGVHYVRFRRVQTLTVNDGIVIGSAMLQEGRVEEGGGRGYYDADPDPPYFSVQRVVGLIEVALAQPVGKAVIVLAWHADLTIVDANATMTPDGAAHP